MTFIPILLIIGTLDNEVIGLKWKKTDLLQAKDNTISFDETLLFDSDSLKKMSRIRQLLDVTVRGTLHYEHHDDLVYVDLDIEGDMVVPCSITLEDVTIPFVTSSTELFSFTDVDDQAIHETTRDEIELLPVIFQLIFMEIPLKVVKEDLKEYPKGEGWEVVKEDEYESRKKDEIDPRLAKLKEFKLKD